MGVFHSSHFAYADESHYNVGRYRGIGLVTMTAEFEPGLKGEIRNLLNTSEVREFAWKKLKGARESFAALKLIDCAIRYACNGDLRIDVLVWDTEDSRHKILGRDDIANLGRMYYHLFENTLRRRWPEGCTWLLRPDENSAIDWDNLKECLQASAKRMIIPGPLSKEEHSLGRIRQDFNVLDIHPCASDKEPIVQLADLFVGMAVYSWQCFEKYEHWQVVHSGQGALFPSILYSLQLSKSDKARCLVMHEFDRKCKSHKLGVSLKSRRGLYTYNPNNPINFWPYTPQHEQDKAPTRS
jgi:hypothetical protein